VKKTEEPLLTEFPTRKISLLIRQISDRIQGNRDLALESFLMKMFSDGGAKRSLGFGFQINFPKPPNSLSDGFKKVVVTLLPHPNKEKTYVSFETVSTTIHCRTMAERSLWFPYFWVSPAAEKLIELLLADMGYPGLPDRSGWGSQALLVKNAFLCGKKDFYSSSNNVGLATPAGYVWTRLENFDDSLFFHPAPVRKILSDFGLVSSAPAKVECLVDDPTVIAAALQRILGGNNATQGDSFDR